MSSPHLTILDVGHGSATVVTGPLGTVLIDAGPGPWVMRYLESQSITHLDAVAITHSDEDHLRGLTALLDSGKFTFGTVRVNSDASKGTALWDAVAFSLDELSKRQEIDFQTQLAVGDPFPPVADGVGLEVLAPSKYLAARGPGSRDRAGRRLTPNSVSAVLRVSVGDEPLVLLGADIDTVGLDNLLSGSDRSLNAPVLVFPHHGGTVGSTRRSADENRQFAERLCAAVSPETVVFSIGRGRHATPRPEIVEAVQASGPAVRVACTQLSERCAGDAPSEQAYKHLLDLPARGRAQGACCAGTVRLALLAGAAPSDAHEEFKIQHLPHALCRPVRPV